MDGEGICVIAGAGGGVVSGMVGSVAAIGEVSRGGMAGAEDGAAVSPEGAVGAIDDD